MSQITNMTSASSMGAILSLTGNSGGAVSPDGAGNIDFLGDTTTINITGDPGANTLTANVTGGTNGQLLIGATAGNPDWAALTSTDGSVTFTTGANSLDLSVDTSAIGAVLSITGDDSLIVVPDATGDIDLTGAHGINTSRGGANNEVVAINNAITLGDLSDLAANTAALTVETGDIIFNATNNVGNLTLTQTHSSGNAGVIEIGQMRMHGYGATQTNVFIGNSAGNFSNTAISSVGIGQGALAAVTSGGDNTAVGTHALEKLTSGSYNTAHGYDALFKETTGSSNTAVGRQAMYNLNGGQNNIAIGRTAAANMTSAQRNIAIGNGGNDPTANEGPLGRLTTGLYNIAIGSSTGSASTGAGGAYTGSESSNICIGPRTSGTTGESNVMRLGATGSSNGQVNKAFIAGTYGITPAGATETVIIDSNGQLGSTASTGGGITWSVLTGSTKAAVVNEGYFSNYAGTLAFTLPTTAAVGDTIEICQMAASQGFTVAVNSGETIYIGNTNTTITTGTLASTDDGDWIELVCRVADTDWQCNVKSGNITVT